MNLDKLLCEQLVLILRKKEQYVFWKRKMLVYLENDDPELLALDPELNTDADNYDEWLYKSKKARKIIIMTLSHSVKFKDFNANVGRIQEICDELAAYRESIEDASFVRILLKSLPRLFNSMDQSAASQDNLTYIRPSAAVALDSKEDSEAQEAADTEVAIEEHADSGDLSAEEKATRNCTRTTMRALRLASDAEMKGTLCVSVHLTTIKEAVGDISRNDSG
eukprot:IDg9806t1